jgi:hypothetical protein
LEQPRLRSPRRKILRREPQSKPSTLMNLSMTTHLHLKRLNRADTLSLIYLREHRNRREFSLGSFMTFNMMQDVLCVLTRRSSQNSKLAPVAWHIHESPYNNWSISSRCLLSDLRNEVSVPAEDHITQRTFHASTHESVHIHYHSL